MLTYSRPKARGPKSSPTNDRTAEPRPGDPSAQSTTTSSELIITQPNDDTPIQFVTDLQSAEATTSMTCCRDLFVLEVLLIHSPHPPLSCHLVSSRRLTPPPPRLILPQISLHNQFVVNTFAGTVGGEPSDQINTSQMSCAAAKAAAL